MNNSETAALLTTFQAYWPTYHINPSSDGGLPGTIEIWAKMLEPYSINEVSRALLQIRSQKERVFAPTASELEGQLLENISEKDAALAAKRLLREKPEANQESTLETYYLEVIVGYKKDGTITKAPRPYVRVTNQRRKEIIAEFLLNDVGIDYEPIPGSQFSMMHLTYPHLVPRTRRQEGLQPTAVTRSGETLNDQYNWSKVTETLASMPNLQRPD